MTDKERLEEIIEKYSEITVLEYINDVEIVGVDMKDLVWLIEQAEKAERYKILFERVVKFMIDNEITCEETIYQCDWVIENAYEFIGDLFNIVELELPMR